MNKVWYRVAVSSGAWGGTMENFGNLQNAQDYAEWLCINDREIDNGRRDIELVYIDRWVQTTERDTTFETLKYVPGIIV